MRKLMSRGLSRNNDELVWQHIKINYLNKYVEDLKSRIYKAFVQKLTIEVHIWQVHFIDSPLVLCLALKQKIEFTNVNLSSFEWGYVILFFNVVWDSDFIFFGHYRKNNFSILKKDLEYLIDEVRYKVINWILDIYIEYLSYLNNYPFVRCYRKNILSTIGYEDYSYYRYAINIDFISCIHYMDVLNLINRLSFIDNVKEYLYSVLGKGIFAELIVLLRLSEDLSVLQKSNVSLVKKIIDVFILTLCYEISTMLSLKESVYFSKSIIVITDMFNVLVMSQEPNHLSLWKKYAVYLLISNGVRFKDAGNLLPISLSKGIDFKKNLIVINYQPYLTILINRPSLYYQFTLLKITSVVINQSRSKPFFLLLIRLNKLLLVWSQACSRYHKRIFFLLDYLMFLKIKCFLKYKKSNFVQKKIIYKHLSKFSYPSKFFIRTNKRCFATYVDSRLYYRQYCMLKLSWLSE
uniref:Putative group II intron reverse transcriptase/maturase protein n=1 Tax=Corallina officinalis TaxID=35170 RepID=A0A6M3WB17_COROI|nr:putative group II intron reverse transcriptase/maturase protein [Corallina officinalis]